jgi:predicted Zn finger-like uncharacterized protein
MNLVTRCPRCQTLYRVAPAQLQARAGQVRCGRCMHVFDGFEALAMEQANAQSEPVHFEPGPGDAPAGPPANTAAAAVSTAAPAAAPALPRPELIGPPKPPLSLRVRRHAAERAAALKQRYIRKPSPGVRRAAACLALALLLVAQVAYAFRSPLAARYAGFRSVMLDVCAIAACSVWLPHRPDLLQKVGEDVSALDTARPGLIQVTVTLRSAATYRIAYPALDLVLTNSNEHALARRIFLPEEYLGGGGNPRAGIPPKAEITLALDLDTGDLNASGFRIDLLPAPAP